MVARLRLMWGCGGWGYSKPGGGPEFELNLESEKDITEGVSDGIPDWEFGRVPRQRKRIARSV